MNVLVIDGQGGGLGQQIVSAVKKNYPEITVIACGTNSSASARMKKAGADHAAAGENAVAVCSRKADVIIGPAGIVIADSMFGEITERMAAAVGKSSAVRLLIPMNQCDTVILGTSSLSLGAAIKEILERLGQMLRSL